MDTGRKLRWTRIFMVCLVALMVCGLLPEHASAAAEGGAPLKIGDHVYFASAAEGETPEVWQVIDVNGDYALIYNLYMTIGVFDATIHGVTKTISLMRYHSYGSASWQYSDVRSWLNSREDQVSYQDIQFDYNAAGIVTLPWSSDSAPQYVYSSGYLKRLTEAEYHLLQPVRHVNLIAYPESGKESVMDTKLAKFPDDIVQYYQEPYGVSESTDLMFLLNGWEFKTYVLNNNLWGYRYPSGASIVQFWLRDSVDMDFAGYYGYYGMNILTVGGSTGSSQADSRVAIRPACYIDMRYIAGLMGTGTFESPYTLSIDPAVLERVPEDFVVSVTDEPAQPEEVSEPEPEKQRVTMGKLNGCDLTWQVVAQDGDRALLFCDYVVDLLDGPMFHYSYQSAFASWCQAFYESSAFTNAERQAMLPTTVDRMNDQYLFFLSESEIVEYYPEEVERQRKLLPGLTGTIGAIGYELIDISTLESPAYWLRSFKADWWIDVGPSGTCINISMYHSRYGVCPAVYVDLKKLEAANQPYSPEMTNHQGVFTYGKSEITGGDLKYTYTYDESLFFNSSYTYQHELTKMSIRVAMAAYGTSTTGTNEEKSANIRSLMNDLGYDRIETDYPDPDTDTIGYAIGSKNIVRDSGETCSIIMVAVRGGGYGQEWGGNFRIGTRQEHEGFTLAASQVLAGLSDYVERYRDELDPNIKIWISGYSRAAAVTNLVAARLDENTIKGVARENIFAFCFECPKTTILYNRSNERYKNIVNIVNPIDIVTKVAPEAGYFSFNRYGTTYYLPSKVFDVTYAAKKMDACAHYATILKYNGMSASEAVKTAALLMREGTQQEAAFSWLIECLANLAYSQQHYVDSGMQAALITLMQNTLGGGDMTEEDMLDLLNSIVKIAEQYKFGTLSSLQATAATALMNLDSCLLLMRAHYPELCMAWLDSLDGAPHTGLLSSKVYLNCPVDVSVYNASGKLVAQITNDQVREIEDGLAAYVDGNGQKIVYLPSGGDYRMAVTATDAGEVTYTVTDYEYGTNVTQRVTSYYDIPVQAGDQLDGCVSSQDSACTLSLNDEELEPSVQQAGDEVRLMSVRVTAEEGGLVSGGGTYVSGGFCKVYAEPVEGACFVGWYDGEQRVSTENTYRFRVAEDTDLVARFVTVDREILWKFLICVIAGGLSVLLR